MNDEDLVIELNKMSMDATGNNATFMALNAELLDRYEGNPYGDEVPERSKVVSNDVMDLVEADMTSLARVFLGPNDIIKFKPNRSSNDEDKKEADQKTKYVDWQIRSQPWSFPVLQGFIKNALLQKLSIVKYFYEETTDVQEHRKKGLSNQELASYKESLNGEDVESVEIVREEEGDEENTIVFRVKRTTKSVKLYNVPLENFRMSKNATSKEDAELIGDVDLLTRGELLSRGYPKAIISQLPLAEDLGDSSRTDDIRQQDQGGDEAQSLASWASERVMVESLYPKIDYDGDGIAERRYILKSGDYILENMVFNHEPYAITSAIGMPHTAIGKSRAELAAPTAFAKTYLLRGVQDNIYAVNQPRMAYNDEVEEDDLLILRHGGGIRTNGDTPPGNHLMPVQIPYIGDKAMQVIQYWDQARAQTTGSLLASQGLDADRLSKETATRFEGIKDISQSKVELVARNLAETGFRQLYEGVAWLNANYQDTETEIEVMGEELTIDPREWKFKHQTKIRVGLGAGDDRSLVETMTGLWTIHAQLREMQSPMTDEVKRFNILKALTKATGIADESEYFNDPEKPEELTLAENEILTGIVQQLQGQVQSLQNPLAEAETIKQRANLMKAQSDAQLSVAKMQEDQRQFNVETAQKQDQFMKELAAKLTELEAKYNVDASQSVQENILVSDPETGGLENAK